MCKNNSSGASILLVIQNTSTASSSARGIPSTGALNGFGRVAMVLNRDSGMFIAMSRHTNTLGVHNLTMPMKHLCFLIRFVLLATFSLVVTVHAQDAADTVVLAWPTQPDSLFPDYARTSNAHFLFRHLYGSLVTTDLEGNLVPDLALSWELSDDQLTWTFNLRHDVVWHDGEPFTAADVKSTFEISADPDYTGWATNKDILGVDAKLAGEADAVEGVQVLDDHTVTITTTEPNALVLQLIGIRDILPAHVLQDIPVADLSGGFGTIATSIVYPGLPEYNRNIEPYPY